MNISQSLISPIERACLFCKKSFTVNTAFLAARKIYCSVSCSNKTYKKKKRVAKAKKNELASKQCLVCQKVFSCRRPQEEAQKKYCSAICYNQSAIIRRKQDRGVVLVDKNCLLCNKLFRQNCKTQIYCSKQCRTKKTTQDWRSINRTQMTVLECLWCGENFSAMYQKVYCSKACKKEDQQYQEEEQESVGY